MGQFSCGISFCSTGPQCYLGVPRKHRQEYAVRTSLSTLMAIKSFETIARHRKDNEHYAPSGSLLKQQFLTFAEIRCLRALAYRSHPRTLLRFDTATMLFCFIVEAERRVTGSTSLE